MRDDHDPRLPARTRLWRLLAVLAGVVGFVVPPAVAAQAAAAPGTAAVRAAAAPGASAPGAPARGRAATSGTGDHGHTAVALIARPAVAAPPHLPLAGPPAPRADVRPPAGTIAGPVTPPAVPGTVPRGAPRGRAPPTTTRI